MSSTLHKQTISILFFLLSSIGLYSQALNGVYTIGESSADFDSISHAVDTLVKYGVSGSVSFEIQPGTYEEQLVIPEIAGANQINTITFKSQTGNKEDVIIQNREEAEPMPGGAEGKGDPPLGNFVLLLDGADYINFENLTIKTLTSYEGEVILFTNSCNHNKFENNIIQAPHAEGSFGSVLISAVDTSDNYNQFIDNEFINGSQAFAFSGSADWSGEMPVATSYDTANVIRGNHFIEQGHGIVFSRFNINMEISSNTFTYDEVGEGYYENSLLLIECKSNRGTKIQNNKMISQIPGAGIYMESCGSSSMPGAIANNFFYFSGYGNSVGIKLSNGTYQHIYYNTFRLETESGGGMEAVPGNAPQRGEVEEWEDGGLIIKDGNNNNILNNLVVVRNGSAIDINSASAVNTCDYNNFYSLNNALGYWDGSSAYNIEEWQSASGQDAHSLNENPEFEENFGYHTFDYSINNKGIPVTGITKDLDGEARNATTPDIGADEFTPPENDAGISVLSFPTYVMQGIQAVKVMLNNYGYNALDTVMINWELDGVSQLPFQWTGSLAAGDSIKVELDNINFEDKKYDFKIWTSQPNNTTDDNAKNDTLYHTIYPPLSGVYEIGGADPDFTDFTSAVARLKVAGIKGSTIFKVRDGIYNEYISIPEIRGVGAEQTITFESENQDSTQVVLRNTGEEPVIKLDGADYISFKKLTIQNISDYFDLIISLSNGASHNIFQNNIIECSSLYRTLVKSNSSADNNNTFKGNIFRNGRRGLYLSGSYNQSQPGNTITGNTFLNQESTAISLSNQSILAITNNTIQSSDVSGFEALSISNCNNGLTILNNKINITDGGKGIYLYNCKGSLQKRDIIANNFITVGGTAASYGFYISNSEYLNIYHNNVNIQSSYNSGATSALYISSGGYFKLTNNIFANTGGYYAVYFSSTPNIQFSDYNNIYSTGENLAYWSEDIIDLAAWQNKSSLDANSFSVDPMYISNTDLHVRQAILYKTGLAIPVISKDIDGEGRDLNNPCIGADEFIALQTDAGITGILNPVIPFEAENQNIKILLKNFGLDTLKTTDINWEFNGATQTIKNWTGNLSTDDTVNVLLGDVNFLDNVANELKVWLTNPNGTTDTNNSNDTLSVTLYKALGGEYTIGGTNPVFNSINEAVNILHHGGLYQPVIFNIREGVYKESIFIKDFPGSSSENTVTFQSEDLDSTKVTLENETDTTTFIIRLSGAHYVSFNKLKITRTNNIYANLVEFINNTTNIHIENTILHNPGDNTAACIYADATENNNIIINNNTIYEGSYGLNLSGNSSTRTENNSIKNNIFSGQRNYSIYLNYHKSPKIEKNTFNNQFTGSPTTACYLSNCTDSIKISKNKIDLQGSTNGIYLSGCAISGYKSRIINNFIFVGGDDASGILLSSCDNISLYFNNINVNGGTQSCAIKSSSGDDNVLYNNNIINSGQGYAINISSKDNLLTSNRNNFYTNGNNLAYCYYSTKQTLEDWKSYTGKDINSLSVDPMYISDSDLHVREYSLKRAGSFVTGITDDIDNDIRHSQNPDIGADEFDLLQRDIGIIQISNFGTGEKTVNALLMNFGAETLTSASINWSVNNALQTPVSWSETLLSEDTTEVALGIFNFQDGQAYTIKAWTSSPNGLTDENSSNDTLLVENQSTSLSGTYTIGGDTPNYPDFKTAVTDLINRGMSDSVIFDVRTGEYNEQISITEISGADKPGAVVFQSESGTNTDVTLYYNQSTSSDNYTIQLDGASNITFKNMTLKADNSSYSRVVEMKKICENILFYNNIIEGYNTSSSGSEYALIYGNNSPNSEFINNTFTKGSYGIYTSQPSNTQGARIINNQFTNQYYVAVRLYNEQLSEITNNTINTSSTNNSYSGISLNYCSSYTINNNKINVQNNGYGINISNSNSTESAKANIYNNFIITGSDNTAEGIQLEYSSFINIYFNNILVNSTHTSYGRCIDARSVQSINLKNNIFYNAGGGYTLHFYSSGNIKSDYNNIYTEGTNLAYLSQNINSFEDWQLISGQDAHSVSVNPEYISSVDLHVSESILYYAGIQVPGITTDIDGQSRNQKPCIGADEFTIDASDAGIANINRFKEGTQDVIVAIKNYGADTLKSAQLICKIDNVDFSTINWTGELLTNDTVHVNMGSSTFNSGQLYQIKAWTNLPNGQTDSNAENDTLSTGVYPALSGEYVIGAAPSDYTSFYDAVEALKTFGVADTVIFKVKAGTYNEQIVIPGIEGAEKPNSVVFTSQNNINTDVELIYNSTSSSQNYTVLLDGAKGVSFRNMTIKAQGTSYSRIVELRGITDYTSFSNNIFQGYENLSASSTNSVSISSFNGKNKNISILNNIFNNSSYAIKIENNITLDNIEINNNTFQNQSAYGIQLEKFSNISISSNTIITNTERDGFYANKLSECTNQFKLNNNKISIPNGGYGIHTDNYEGTETEAGLIYNNFIYIGGTSTSAGIYISSPNYLNVYFNSINIANTNTSGKALYCYSAENTNIKNNNLVSSDGAYNIYIQYPQGNIESNYNNLYTNGTFKAYWNTDISSFSGWKSTSGNDANSVSIDPMYISKNDLHVKEILLDGSATPIPVILHDIDGETRNTENPDIGADEFIPLDADAGIVAMATPVSPFMHGENEIFVTLRNFGTDTLKTVDINWEFNKETTLVNNWTGNLPPAQSIEVILGIKNFLADTVNSLKAWTTNPGGNADINNINDTLFVDSIFTALNGEYILGGTANPDFDNFNHAVENLNLRGITGAVTFKVAPGTYNEQMIITGITGAGEKNSVTFTSQNNDSTSVRLQFNSTTSDKNYVIKLDGADGITFRGITIKSLNSDYGRVVELSNGAHKNSFENNRLEGVSKISSSNNLSLIYSNNTTNNYNLFKNNLFKEGAYGVYLSARNGISNYGKGNALINNIFENQYSYGVYSYYQKSMAIERNWITNQEGNDSYQACYIYNNADSISIQNNKINLQVGSNAINLDHYQGESSNKSFIANNFITHRGNNEARGIYAYYSKNLNICYNNINTLNTNTSSRSIYMYRGSGNEIHNNNFVNTGGGYAIYVYYTSSVSLMDCNNYFVTGDYLGYWNNKRAKLADWQTASNKDANSVSIDPKFASPTDLHVNEVLLNNTAIPVLGVTKDIDGETRNENTPDIGADEFTPVIIDEAGVIEILGFDVPFAEGEKEVKVIIRNFGTNTIDSLQINWECNQVQQSEYIWKGTLNSTETDTISIGTYNFSINTDYKLKTWTSLPNGHADSNNSNDTTTIGNIYVALNGTYTIAKSGADFVSFSEASDNLNLGGILGHVTFNVADGTYDEQITLGEIEGSSSDAAITFQSGNMDSTKVILSYQPTNSDNYVVKINGADYITFKNISIKSVNSAYNRVIELTNEADFITFKNNIIEADPNYNDYEVIYSGSTKDDYLELINNFIINGKVGVQLASTYNNHEYGTTIKGNTFNNQYSEAISLNYQRLIEIVANTITTSSGNNQVKAISLRNSVYSYKILQNNIQLPNGGYGLYLYDADAYSYSRALIANNFIQVGGASVAYGIYNRSSSYQNFYHNSIHLNNSSGNAYCFYSHYSDNSNLYNNIFCNSGNGYAYYSYGTSEISNSDNNDIFTAGSKFAYWGEAVANLEALKTISGKDQNSLSVNPQFISPTDLHVQEFQLNNTGKPLSAVNTDIDGETRSTTTPDIGADEFDIANENDAGILALTSPVVPFAEGDHDVFLVIKNFGTDTLKTLNIQWEINGERQALYNWTGELLQSETDTINMGSYNFLMTKNHMLTSWAELPNGTFDNNAFNDTLTIENLNTSLGGELSIGGDNPHFENFSSALKRIEQSGVHAPVTFYVRDGEYNEQLLIEKYTGVDSTNNITFLSESNDSTKVTLSYAGNDSKNYVINLDGASNYTFKGMTIKNTNSSYGRVITLQNGANNQFIGNIIQGATYSTVSTTRALVYSSGTVEDSIAFKNNIFNFGSYGLYLYGDYNENGQNLIIENNTFNDQREYAIYARYQSKPQITGNSFNNSQDISYYIACYISNVEQLGIHKNTFDLKENGTGIYLGNIKGSETEQSYITNNFIHIGGTTTAYGIDYTNSEFVHIYHNSIHLTNTSTSSACIHINTGSELHLLNNICSNPGGGYSIYVTNSGVLNSSDYNDLYTTGTNLSYFGSDKTDLSAWQTATGFDANSLSVDPIFNSNADLHVNEILLNAKGLYTPMVTDDIDGEPRNTNTPDIGADEFNPPAANDAGIITLINPQKPFNKGENEIKVSFKNYGTQNLTSVYFNWQINGVTQESYYWTGNILPGETDTVKIGSFNFEDKAGYNAIIWTTLPNNITDSIAVNDTIIQNDLYASLAGEYTIGATESDFIDFKQATDVLIKAGISDTVTFIVKEGLYQNKLHIHEIMGASENSPVIFRSEFMDNTGVVLSSEGSYTENYTLLLDSSDFISFEYITIQNTAPYYGRVIQLQNGADNNTFKNLKIQSSRSSLVSLTNKPGTENTFKNNEFINGYYGIDVNTSDESAIIIENNTFTSQDYGAVKLENITNSEITGNIISSNSGNSKGIIVNSSKSFRIERNKINLNGGAGIDIRYSDGVTGNKILVANNFISIGGSGISQGIYLYYNNLLTACFNNINIISGNASSKALYYQSGANNQVINNNLCNFGGGYSSYIYNADGLIISDYNNLYTTGDILAYWETDCNTLNDFQATGNKEAHSLNLDPLYISDDDLHTRNIALDKKGIPVANVTEDYDKETRDPQTPDIGADEFSTYNKDIGIKKMYPEIVCGYMDNQEISVTIQNYGKEAQTAFDVIYIINENDTVTENVGALSIPSGESAEYSFLQTYDFVLGESYTITAITSLMGDEAMYNDTLQLSFINPHPFKVTTDANKITCSGEEIKISASGAALYNWSNGAKKSTITVSPVETTTYYVTATAANGCIDTDSVKVNVNPLPEKPVIDIQGALEFCHGGSVILTSSITNNITWSNNKTTASVTIDKSGNYFVKHTDNNNCSAYSDTLTVLEDTRPVIRISPGTDICYGDTVQISALGATSYNWSTGETLGAIKVWPVDTTEYTLITGTQMGCTYYDTITVNVYPSVQPGEITYLLPHNHANNLSIPVNFSWMQAENTELYDLYVWHKDSVMPGNPNVSNITTFSKSYSNESFTYGDTVNWKIHAKNACYETEGEIWQFITRKLPELHVSSVSTSAVHSGVSIDVSWTVVNDGEGETVEGEWYDRVWLTPDIGINYYESEDELLGIFQNPVSLAPGESYQQTQQVTLPENLIGTYYLIVITDALDIWNIKNGENTTPPVPYNPPPYWSGISLIDNFTQVDLVKEASDIRVKNSIAHKHLYHDNFYYIELNFSAPPLPDLMPTAINIPENTYSGETIPVSWSVKNTGSKNLGSEHWSDRIYLSQNEEFNLSNATLLGTFPYAEGLLVNESYTQNKAIELPENKHGEFYIYVLSDFYDNVFEHLHENNNILRSANKINIILTPPPDLEVVDMEYPDSAYNGQKIEIQWDVTNQGAKVPVNTIWHDNIYLSQNPDYTLQGAKRIGSKFQNYTLEASGSYHSTRQVYIPWNIKGNYYLYIKTDADNTVFEHVYENNNLLRSAVPIKIQAPDLVVENIQVKGSVNSGEWVDVEWETWNWGKGTLVKFKYVNEEVYISNNEIFNSETSTLLAKKSFKQSLESNQYIKQSAKVKIPEGISGDYYIHIKTDVPDYIFENDESNNLTTGKAIKVKLADWPDLIPSEIIIPTDVIAGSQMKFKYTVSNQGQGSIINKEWKDIIFISKYSTLDDKALQLEVMVQNRILESSGIYSDSLMLAIPYDIKPGYYYLHLKTDNNNNIYEHTDEWNNTIRSIQVYIEEHPPVNMAVTSFSVPAAVNSGKSITFSYKVENTGEFSTFTNYWHDILYLSADTIPDASDHILSKNGINKSLNPGESYSETRTATIPNGISGDYYAIIRTDVENSLQDIDLSDNTQYKMIPITLSLSPDLELSNINIPSGVQTGVPFEISWQVSNKGETDIENTAWIDKIVISTDNILDKNDEEIYSKTRYNKLSINQSYFDTINVTIPHQYEGNHYIIAKTDFNNSIYEYQAEENNQHSKIVLVQRPDPSDIIVSEITAPTEAFVAGDLTLSWKLKNIGNNPVEGKVKDIISISKDTIWDVSDPVIGEYQSYIKLLQMQEETRSITQKLNAASIGNNHILVKTDVFNRIYELNDTNNTFYSDTILVKANELQLGIKQNSSLANNQPQYYQLEITADKEGETLLSTLKGDSLYGNNEVYIKYGELPTRIDYDYKYPVHFSGNQQIIIPELKAGIFYYMIYGSTSEASQQNISLLADILNFEIMTVDANKGINAGNITVKITGAKFRESISVKLCKQSSDTLEAVKIQYINASQIYATFNLKNADAGLYDVFAQCEEDEYTLEDAFEILASSDNNGGNNNNNNNNGGDTNTGGECYTCIAYDQLAVDIQHVDGARPNRLVTITIFYKNNGLIDIPVPVKEFISLKGAPLGFSPEELDENKQSLLLEFKEEGGPEQILRPGAQGSIVIYTKSIAPIEYILLD